MPTPPFKYQEPFPLGKDDTEYYLLTKDHVSVSQFEGKEILKVNAEGLVKMANAAMHDCSFFLRAKHNEQVASVLSDPEASDNDKFVALTMLRNAEISAKGVLPFCQDTGTAIVIGKKGQQVWTDSNDEEALSKGIYETYTKENLRYSQTIPLDMYTEKTQVLTCLHKSICMQRRAMNINFYSSQKEEVLPIKPFFTRKQKLC
jgi:fumarate hydratase class I